MSAWHGNTGAANGARRYQMEPMMTNFSVAVALYNKQLIQDPQYVKQVIGSYIDVKRAHGRQNWEISQKLELIERDFPKFGQYFIQVRREKGLPDSRVFVLRRTSSSSNPLHRAQTFNNANPSRVSIPAAATMNRRVSTPAAPRPAVVSRPVNRDPEAGEDAPPPPYTTQDPEPEATRLLQERIAAEAEANGTPVTSVSSFQSPTTANPAPSSPGPAPSPRRTTTPPSPDIERPPSDPDLARVWEESQLAEAKRASMAWQREQDELEEVMRLSLAESASSGQGSSTGPGTRTQQDRPSGTSHLPVVDEDEASLYEPNSSQAQYTTPDTADLMGEMNNLSMQRPDQSSLGTTGNRQSSILDRDDADNFRQPPLVPTKTGHQLQSKNPFLSTTEQEYAEAAADSQQHHIEEGIPDYGSQPQAGSSRTTYTNEPLYAPPPHLRRPTSLADASKYSNSPQESVNAINGGSLAPSPLPVAHDTSYSQQQQGSTDRGLPPSLPPRPSRSSYVAPKGGEDPLEMLRDFDTVFLVDDSTSMQGPRWIQAEQAIMEVADIAARYDDDGVDVYFLNSKRVGKELRSGSEVADLFRGLEPKGATPMGMRLETILRDYMSRLERSQVASPSTSQPSGEEIQPMNLIVVTDGAFTYPITHRLRHSATDPTLSRTKLLETAPSDDPESVLIACAKRLDRGEFPLSQIGVQFLQIGDDSEAREALQELDDGLSSAHGVRDMVDTVLFEGEEMSAGLIIKTLLGGVNRRLDRRRTGN